MTYISFIHICTHKGLLFPLTDIRCNDVMWEWNPSIFWYAVWLLPGKYFTDRGRRCPTLFVCMCAQTTIGCIHFYVFYTFALLFDPIRLQLQQQWVITEYYDNDQIKHVQVFSTTIFIEIVRQSKNKTKNTRTTSINKIVSSLNIFMNRYEWCVHGRNCFECLLCGVK